MQFGEIPIVGRLHSNKFYSIVSINCSVQCVLYTLHCIYTYRTPYIFCMQWTMLVEMHILQFNLVSHHIYIHCLTHFCAFTLKRVFLMFGSNYPANNLYTSIEYNFYRYQSTFSFYFVAVLLLLLIDTDYKSIEAFWTHLLSCKILINSWKNWIFIATPLTVRFNFQVRLLLLSIKKTIAYYLPRVALTTSTSWKYLTPVFANVFLKKNYYHFHR